MAKKQTNQAQPKVTKTPRATAAQIEERVNVVFSLLVNGATRYQVQRNIKEKYSEWGIDTRQLDRYIQKANELIAAEAEYLRPRELARSLIRTNDVYAKTMKVQDYQRALAANDQRNKIIGLYAPQKMEITHLFDEAGITVELFAAWLEALQSRGMSAGDLFNSMIIELNEEAETENHK